jgi:O-succinylbenzoate synthase
VTPDFRIWRYELPLAAPVSLAPGVAMSVREGLLLEIVEGGRSFWGEASPLPEFSRESLEDARRRLEGAMAKLSRAGRHRRGAAAVSASLSPGSPSVEFALASAFVGLDEADGERLDPYGAPDHSVAVCGLLSGGRDEVLSDAARLRKDGYEAVKLKVGRGGVEDDAALVGEVREILGGDVSLRLDANRAWSFEEAGRFGRLVAEAGIEFVEEPLEGAERLRELSETTGLPVALDESLVDMDYEEAKGHEYARAFVLKPTVIGFSRSASFASAAKKLGARAIISSSYESGVGTLGLLRIAASFGRGAPDSTRTDASRRTYFLRHSTSRSPASTCGRFSEWLARWTMENWSASYDEAPYGEGTSPAPRSPDSARGGDFTDEHPPEAKSRARPRRPPEEGSA